MEKTTITITATVAANPSKVWAYWTKPEHIVKWNFASDDWHCPTAENNLSVGGTYNARMESKDGSMGFNFIAVYTQVIEPQKIAYTMADGRQATTTFENDEGKTKVTTTFDAESTNPIDLQKAGWQAILNNFKQYVELSSMQKMQYQISINAPAEQVYQTMLGLNNKNTYRQWTAEFNPSSTYDGSWEQGSKILFIGTDDNGVRAGMVARIAENIPNKFVSIQHYGIVSGETEITSGEEVEKWAGSLENYTFTQNNGVTLVSVEVDVSGEYQNYFETVWPKALLKLKQITEALA